MENDVGLVTGFKLVSGEEIIFKGIQTGQFGQIFNIPKAVMLGGGEADWNMFGHLVGNPFIIIAPEAHVGKAWRLEPFPRMRRWKTCDEIFIKDRDVMFQMMTVEIDEDILALYDKVLEDQKWRVEHEVADPLG